MPSVQSKVSIAAFKRTRFLRCSWAKAGLLVLLFLFRLGFGLCSEFWLEDEKQTFLIGLKFHATHQWPYFGPDVDYPHIIQQPGALEGLLIGLPLDLLRVPEAPFILLNILSFGALSLFAWYCSRRLPEIPSWLIWSWLFIAPWTLSYSTHIVNLSYLLPGSMIFFLGFLESCPPLRQRLLSARLANLMMGFGLCWVMQFHISWVLLVPFVLLSFYFQSKVARDQVLGNLGLFIAGVAVTGSLILPTFLHFGLKEGLGGTESTVGLNVRNLLNIYNLPEGIIGRFFSYSSFEIPRFIGRHTVDRLEFFRRQPWLVPFGTFLLIVGIFQPISMLLLWFRKQRGDKDWKRIKYLMAGTLALLYLSFLFANEKPPSAHTYYVMLPVSMLYAFYCWRDYLSRNRWQRFAAVVIVCAIVFQFGLAIDNFRNHSLYLNRGIVQEAIDSGDYRILSERRVGARY
jgi:hypothetical protein